MPYQYRNFSCLVVPESELHCVVGRDKKNLSAGVLEWCTSMADAESVKARMEKDKDRFSDLTARKYRVRFDK